MALVLVTLAVAVLAAGVCLCLLGIVGLTRQNGRLLLRIEDLEAALARVLVDAGSAPPVVTSLEAALSDEYLTFRDGTNDFDIAYEVVYQNCYRLPETFGPDDVIIDVGAHVGFFSLSVLARGCGEVYSYEPDPGNAAGLRRHLAPFGERAHVYEAAVWRSDRDVALLQFQPSAAPTNLGGGGVIYGSGRPVPAVRFDDVLAEATRNGERRIRLLKLDCEGSEYPILLTSKMLHLVDEICGEYHVLSDALHAEFEHELTPEALDACLRDAGFEVEWLPSDWAGGETNAMGLFFARRR